MRSPIITLTCLCMFVLNVTAQNDTIICYTHATQQMDTILPVPYDTSLTFGFTPSFEGYLSGVDVLSDVFPTSNLLSDVEHTHLELAIDRFDVGNYPARAAVKLANNIGDSLHHVCSGMMVSRKYVLTAAHCVLSYSDGSFYGGQLTAIPGFDHGEANPEVASTLVERTYVFKRNLGAGIQAGYDLALLELSEPIGNLTGWVGIGFQEDDFLESNVFHKFSYPREALPGLDPPGRYNGDTMYYDHGSVDILGQYFGIQSPEAAGRVGQSGSSFFVANDGEPFSLGVMSWSAGYSHTRITGNIFNQLKPLIEADQLMASNEDEEMSVSVVNVFPNPTTSAVTIDLGTVSFSAQVRVFNPLGQEVHSQQYSNESRLQLSIPGNRGVYFLELTTDNRRDVIKVMKK